MSRKPTQSLGSLAALMALGGGVAHAQNINPILQYNFNNSGQTTSNTGTDTSSNSSLTFLSATGGTNTATTAADLHGSATSGVSGLAGDIAFNNTAANNMGRATTNGGGAARNVGAGPGATTLPTGGPAGTMNLKSFTIEGWFKTDGSEILGGDARLFSNAASNPSTIVTATGNQGFYLSGQGAGSTGQLQLSVNGGTVISSSAAFLTDTGTWTFYAATFDGTTGAVNFYRGTQSTAVASAGTGVYNFATGVTSVQYNPAFFGLGNFPNPDSAASFSRPFDGFLDDMRLYGSTTDGSGALLLRDLDTIRVADLVNVNPVITPEPSQTAAFGLGFLGLAGLAFKARKRQTLA